uniref:ERF family protein n=1 Tax=Alloprevotella sp. TaxID=1872471 RepID=UPI004028BBCB
MSTKEKKTDIEKSFAERVVIVQKELKAPKSQYNSFGKYRYRNAEDILNSVKPLLAVNDLILTLSDELIALGSRIYVKATATLQDCNTANAISVDAYAREDEVRKGMDGSQITGAASSYARKYALNGLFLIDDTKDADATNDGTHEANNNRLQEALNLIAQANNRETLNKIWNTYTDLHLNEKFSQTMADACKKYPKQ